MNPGRNVLIPLVLFMLGAYPSLAQPEPQNHAREFVWGINKNTSGGLIGGIVLKKSIRVSERAFRTYGLEIMNVTHPQESRIRSRAGTFFIYGKSHYLYALRLQYGRDLILFEKSRPSGVQIRGVLAVGPTIGIVSPYYIQWLKSSETIEHEAYDPGNPSHAYSKIIGPGFLLEGLGESKIQMGGNLKIGLGFETGVVKNQITGFEVGFLLDAYFDKVVMLPTAENSALFPTLYFTLIYGYSR